MHKSATKCNETIGKWCKNKHGASKIIDTLETYQYTILRDRFRINGNNKELIGNVSSNNRRVPRDTEKVLDIIGNVLMKELC
jgi:hypothetical protein